MLFLIWIATGRFGAMSARDALAYRIIDAAMVAWFIEMPMLQPSLQLLFFAFLCCWVIDFGILTAAYRFGRWLRPLKIEA